MEHLEYSKELNSFAYYCHQNTLDFVTEETKTRVLLGRLYYALVHFYFSKYPELASSSGTNKHETLSRILDKENPKESRLFHQLKKLRVWSDYQPHNKAPFDINIKRLFHEVNKLINSKNI